MMSICITGGAGFIGCDLADYHLRQVHRVTIFDNPSRKGTEKNLKGKWYAPRSDLTG